MTPKITVNYWNYHCGDGCCYDYGVEVSVNGKSIASHFDVNLTENIKDLFEEMKIDVEIEELENYMEDLEGDKNDVFYDDYLLDMTEVMS